MNNIKISFSLVIIVCLASCASGYKLIEPQKIEYISAHEREGVLLAYKYDLLDKKYAKKELKKGVKLVSVKITNNSEQDLMFGRDIKLMYENGEEVIPIENQKVFTTLKQGVAPYLFYLLLTPINFYTTKTDQNGLQETTSSTPIGLILGPGLAGGNMIAAGSANKKFKTELLTYNINGLLIKKGETKYGLIGIEANTFDALRIKLE